MKVGQKMVTTSESKVGRLEGWAGVMVSREQ